MCGGSLNFGKWMSSYETHTHTQSDQPMRQNRPYEQTHVERLAVPVLDLLDRRHLAEIVRQLVELLGAMGKTDGELLCYRTRVNKERKTGRGDVVDGPARNWLALNNVPCDGFWPKRTICCKDTVSPVRQRQREQRNERTNLQSGERTQSGESCPTARR